MAKWIIRLQLYRDSDDKDDYVKYFICDSEDIAKKECKRIIKNFYKQENGKFKDCYTIFYNDKMNPRNFGCYDYLEHEYYYGHRFKNYDYEIQFYLQIRELGEPTDGIINVW